MTTATRTPRRTGLLLSFLVFVLLGLPEGVLGPVWPSMRASLDRPVSSLAWLVGFYTVGYLTSTVAVGRVLDRFGIAATLQAGMSAAAVGLLVYALTPYWLLAVAAAAVSGTGGGTVDATTNTYVAHTGGVRAMNLLHAFFGVGATLGPIAVTVVLDLDVTWRLIYAALVAVQLTLLALVSRRRHHFAVQLDGDDHRSGRRQMPRPLLGAMLAVFFCYVGAEVAYGAWSFSVLTDERGVSDAAAGWAVAGYWGGLTLGRVGLGVVGNRLAPPRVLGVSAASVVVGALVFWLDPLPAADLVALPWLGLAMAGIFPAMVSLTPGWLGAANTGTAVGYQLAASSLGAIAVSAVLGLAARAGGLDVVAPILAAVVSGTLLAVIATTVVAAQQLPLSRTPGRSDRSAGG